MRHAYLAALMGSTALLSTAVLAQTNAPAQPGARPAQSAPAQPGATAPLNVCQELVTFVERRGTAQPASPVTTDQARTFQRSNDVVACRDGLVRIQGAGIQVPAALALIVQQPAEQQAQATTTTPGQGERITVQQPAATLQVEQAPPQVTVQQARPQVTVRQAQPEIIVRQAPPTITVQMPNPEIIVRMPEPEVNVTQGRPEVSVNVSAPTVSMVQPTAQPQVQIQPSQAQVTVQRPQAVAGQDNVDIQRAGAPIVRFERTGEARVVMNQQEGQPNIRFEKLAQGEANAGARTGQQVATTPAGAVTGVGAAALGVTRAPVTAVERRRLVRERLDADAVAAPGTFPVKAAATRPLRIVDLEKYNVYNLRGEQLGDVERIIMNTADNRQYAVISHGGFLGLFEDRVAIPLDRMFFRGDTLIIRGITEQELDALPDWRRLVPNQRELGDNMMVNVGVYQ